MYADMMPRDSSFMETTVHGSATFPIQCYVDELYKFNNRSVPLHWHPEPEFYVIQGGTVSVQLGTAQFLVHEGDGILINGNTLHRFEQLDIEDHCICPNIVFSSDTIAPATSALFQKYLKPLIANPSLPYILLSRSVAWQRNILDKILHLYALLANYGSEGAYGPLPAIQNPYADIASSCYELEVQADLNCIYQILFKHFDEIPLFEQERNEIPSQVRVQRMLSFIQGHYGENITLRDIANAANISKSEAARCFHAYLRCSPVEYLLQHRIENAQIFLHKSVAAIDEIASLCGFRSTSYFIRAFRHRTGVTPFKYRKQTVRLSSK